MSQFFAGNYARGGFRNSFSSTKRRGWTVRDCDVGYQNLYAQGLHEGRRYSGLSSALFPLLSGVGAILMLHHVRPDEGGVGLNRLLHIEPEFLDRLLERSEAGRRALRQPGRGGRPAAKRPHRRTLPVRDARRRLSRQPPARRAGLSARMTCPTRSIHLPRPDRRHADLWWELLEMDRRARRNRFRDGPTAAGHWSAHPREKHRAYAR
jgi:hypothetical protein